MIFIIRIQQKNVKIKCPDIYIYKASVWRLLTEMQNLDSVQWILLFSLGFRYCRFNCQHQNTHRPLLLCFSYRITQRSRPGLCWSEFQNCQMTQLRPSCLRLGQGRTGRLDWFIFCFYYRGFFITIGSSALFSKRQNNRLVSRTDVCCSSDRKPQEIETQRNIYTI